MNVAVVGGGISGMTAAYLLGKQHNVTLFERNTYVGGHTNTIGVKEHSRTIPIDTGFIVCNQRTYPLFYNLLDQWGVERRDSDMSFGYCCEHSDIGYVGPSIREFLRKPRNLFDGRMRRLLREFRRFNATALADLDADRINDCTLGDYLNRVNASPFFIEHYLVPLAAAVWSSPDKDMLHYPATTFIRFMANHGMLSLRNRPIWQTIVGGSQAYVRAFLNHFNGTVVMNAAVEAVHRNDNGVSIVTSDAPPRAFDKVVMAAHADETLSQLADPSIEEHDALSTWHFHPNTVQLHTDASVMPDDRRVWASWNYHRRADADPKAPVPVTYWMNRLQGLDCDHDYLVSLNAKGTVNEDRVIYEVEYTHPHFTDASIASQDSIRALNGVRNTYFAGAYLGYGFHEDGVASAVEVARHFGVTL